MVEYVDQKITKLSWQVTDKRHGSLIITGSCDYGPDNTIQVWKFLGSPDMYQQLPIVNVATQTVASDVTQVFMIGDLAFVSLANGSVLLYEYQDDEASRYFDLKLKCTDLHEGYRCKDMLFNPTTNSVITCGGNGKLAAFNIDRPNKVSSYSVCGTSINTIDLSSPNEVICGTLSGHIKQYDLRMKKCVKSLASQRQSAITSVKHNPNVMHFVTCGSANGQLTLYDLRNDGPALAQIEAHSAAISQVKYKPSEPCVLFSSSFDGQLIRWNFSGEIATDQRPKKVECIASRNDCLSINSFDVNQYGDMIYACDNEALYHVKVDESV